jgi:hypothetical protein
LCLSGGLRSGSSSRVGVPGGVSCGGAKLIGSIVGLGGLVGIGAGVGQWSSWGEWLSPWVASNVSKELHMEGVIWVWGIQSLSLRTSSGGGVGVPCGVSCGITWLIEIETGLIKTIDCRKSI